MIMSWATWRVRACTKIYDTGTSALSTKSKNPMIGIPELLPMTKSIVV